VAASEAVEDTAFVDTVPQDQGDAPAESAREGGRRRRRGGRGRREREAGVEGLATDQDGVSPEAAPETETPVEPVEGQASPEDVRSADAAEGEGRRGRGGRDRYRRERRPQEGVEENVEATVAEAAVAPPADTAVEAAPAVAPVAAVRPQPVMVPRYDLPLSSLNELAASAGLEWVQSDADKVRAAQELIASTPQPIHVPRERKPVVALDDGPLVLVETRKDLSQITLPFEAAQTAPTAQAAQQQQ
jgi:ribonuclease E